MTQQQVTQQVIQTETQTERALPRTPPPSEADIKWAQRYGWRWTGRAFEPEPMVTVIPNPMESTHPGWTPWHASIGALQMDAPWASVRAALRVAEAVRRGRRLEDHEMSCAEEPWPGT